MFFPGNTSSKSEPRVMICLSDFPEFFCGEGVVDWGSGHTGYFSFTYLFIDSDFVRLTFRTLCPRRSKVFITVLAPLSGNQILRSGRLSTQARKRALSCPLGTTYPMCPASFPKSHTIHLVLFARSWTSTPSRAIHSQKENPF